MFLSEMCEFPSAPCFCRGKKNLMTTCISMLLKSRMLSNMLPFNLCNKKRLAIRHMNRQTPLSNFTIDSVRHREVGRAKDLSAPPCTSHQYTNYLTLLQILPRLYHSKWILFMFRALCYSLTHTAMHWWQKTSTVTQTSFSSTHLNISISASSDMAKCVC